MTSAAITGAPFLVVARALSTANTTAALTQPLRSALLLVPLFHSMWVLVVLVHTQADSHLIEKYRSVAIMRVAAKITFFCSELAGRFTFKLVKERCQCKMKIRLVLTSRI